MAERGRRWRSSQARGPPSSWPVNDRASADSRDADGASRAAYRCSSWPRRVRHTCAHLGFVLGERTEREGGLTMLGAALVRHGREDRGLRLSTRGGRDLRPCRGGERFSSCFPHALRRPLAEAGQPRFPVSSWMARAPRAWLVSGPCSCARDVLHDVKRVFDTKIHAGDRLDARGRTTGRRDARGVLVLSASAGLVPIRAARPEEGARKRTCARSSIASAYARATGPRSGATPARSPGPRSLRLPFDATKRDQGGHASAAPSRRRV